MGTAYDPARHDRLLIPTTAAGGHLQRPGADLPGHTHLPTIWNRDNLVIENVDWERDSEGVLRSRWKLPNGIEFGATARFEHAGLLLKAAEGYSSATNDNKQFGARSAAVRHERGGPWLVTEWERTGRLWGNPSCPCMHSDPVLPDCAAGDTVEVRGRLRLADSPLPGE